MMRSSLGKTKAILLCFGLVCAMVGTAHASLTSFQTFVGNVGYSSDGFGSLSNSGTISASVPAGSTVLGAFLYSGFFNFGGAFTPTATLNGTAVAFGPQVLNTTACCGLGSVRADVTSIVAPVINGGPGGIYNFTVTEGNSRQDGEALVVVFSNPSLPISTVGILDGFSAVTGDTTSINFANPLNPAAPGFFAEMIIGDNFSCCSQRSSITVNATLITQNAGNNDDGAQVANGSLITVGGFDDPFSPLLPTYAADHERYNLVPFITLGDTSIVVNTINPSHDDNIFMATFYVFGRAGINVPPPEPEPGPVSEPSSVLLLGGGLVGLGWRVRRKLG